MTVLVKLGYDAHCYPTMELPLAAAGSTFCVGPTAPVPEPHWFEEHEIERVVMSAADFIRLLNGRTFEA